MSGGIPCPAGRYGELMCMYTYMNKCIYVCIGCTYHISDIELIPTSLISYAYKYVFVYEYEYIYIYIYMYTYIIFIINIIIVQGNTAVLTESACSGLCDAGYYTYIYIYIYIYTYAYVHI
jgi:hypothetical protein